MLRGIEGPHENPWGQPAASRTDWIGDIPVRVLQPGEQAPEYLFWVGCAGAFDDRAKQTTQSVARLLNAAGIDWAVLGPRERCTGDPARRMGHEYLFQMLAEQNVATFSEAGVRTIVATCAHCFNTLANEYPDYGGLVRGRAPHRAAGTSDRGAASAHHPRRPGHRDVSRRLLPRTAQRELRRAARRARRHGPVRHRDGTRARAIVLLRRRRRAYVDGGGRRRADQRHAVRRGGGHGGRHGRGRVSLLLRDAR